MCIAPGVLNRCGLEPHKGDGPPLPSTGSRANDVGGRWEAHPAVKSLRLHSQLLQLSVAAESAWGSCSTHQGTRWVADRSASAVRGAALRVLADGRRRPSSAMYELSQAR